MIKLTDEIKSEIREAQYEIINNFISNNKHLSEIDPKFLKGLMNDFEKLKQGQDIIPFDDFKDDTLNSIAKEYDEMLFDVPTFPLAKEFTEMYEALLRKHQGRKLNIKMTNEIKADMKKRQYNILKKFFDDNFDDILDSTKNNKYNNYIHIIKALHHAYFELPNEIKKFEDLAKMDLEFENLKKKGYKVPNILRLNSETRTLEEIANEFRFAYYLDKNKPCSKEFYLMYRDMVNEYGVK